MPKRESCPLGRWRGAGVVAGRGFHANRSSWGPLEAGVVGEGAGGGGGAGAGVGALEPVGTTRRKPRPFGSGRAVVVGMRGSSGSLSGVPHGFAERSASRNSS